MVERIFTYLLINNIFINCNFWTNNIKKMANFLFLKMEFQTKSILHSIPLRRSLTKINIVFLFSGSCSLRYNINITLLKKLLILQAKTFSNIYSWEPYINIILFIYWINWTVQFNKFRKNLKPSTFK